MEDKRIGLLELELLQRDQDSPNPIRGFNSKISPLNYNNNIIII